MSIKLHSFHTIHNGRPVTTIKDGQKTVAEVEINKAKGTAVFSARNGRYSALMNSKGELTGHLAEILVREGVVKPKPVNTDADTPADIVHEMQAQAHAKAVHRAAHFVVIDEHGRVEFCGVRPQKRNHAHKVRA